MIQYIVFPPFNHSIGKRLAGVTNALKCIWFLSSYLFVYAFGPEKLRAN